jgi:hypothetical protein
VAGKLGYSFGQPAGRRYDPPVRATLCAISLVTVACGAPAKTAARPAATSVAWRQLGSWSGHGNAQTESFSSDTGTLRVRWQARATDGNSSTTTPFRLAAHSAISGRLLQPVVEHTGPGEGIGYVQQDPHVLYIVVESGALAWTVTVEEAVGYSSN